MEGLLERTKTTEKQELVRKIESARKKMDDSIEARDDYEQILQYSVELDRLIEQYFAAGYSNRKE